MPFINGKYYMNPAYGRAVQRARMPGANAEPPGPNDQAAGGHWVTIDHRHVFIDEARSRIAATARKYGGSTAWAFDKRKDDFGPNTNKCNKFVYDVAKEAGAPAIVIAGDGKPRPPLAASGQILASQFPAGGFSGRTKRRSPAMLRRISSLVAAYPSAGTLV